MAPRVTPARMAAFRVLLAMERSSNAHCDDLLRAPAMESLSQADRNLTTALVMGVLRWQLALDAILARHLQRKSPLDAEVAIALRLGAWQLLGMDRIPAHAALTESVELTKVSGHSFASGLVNAVLRRVAENASSIVLDPISAHPAWMVERWTAQFGRDAAASIAAHNQHAPPVALRLSATADADAESLPAGALLTRARRLIESGDAPESMRIQDEGSQLVAELAGRASRILDCCAAPGGKTAILAENNPQAEITASDISETRLNAMRRSFACDPLTAKIHWVHADATNLPFRDGAAVSGSFDLIVCDAPCSGTGTLARNPEIKLRLAVSDLQRQQERQIAILRSVYRVLAPGGRLVYSTCSLEAEENAMVVETILASEPTARLLDVGERLTTMEAEEGLHPHGAELLRRTALRDNGCLQTLPGVSPCDGFFAAILTRNSTARA
ncbi:MAG: rRNA (cytosine967-C5)-methyltransferase [Acidobacteriaceae bacterium]|jgi:16S rRNA (cytosine967-C5)-methyltransferase|nr:rRNA (cytosine967-C5)-methyltransferase [Acidobacteriaceae bacterium]